MTCKIYIILVTSPNKVVKCVGGGGGGFKNCKFMKLTCDWLWELEGWTWDLHLLLQQLLQPVAGPVVPAAFPQL